MPYAEDFEAAASSLGRVARAAQMLSSPLTVASGPDVLSGGQLTTALTAVLDDSAAKCTHSSFELEELAQECLRRAEVCREATAATHTYQQTMRQHTIDTSRWRVHWAKHQDNPEQEPSPGLPPRHPSPPPRPPRWVEIK